MSTIKPARLIRKRRLHVYHGRGDLYSWLRTHYQDILALEQTQPHLWAALVLDMIADGITNACGGNPRRAKVREAWLRVCRDIAAEVAAEAAAPWKFTRKPPSKVSPNWRPIVVIRPGKSPPPGWPADRVEIEAEPTRPRAAASAGGLPPPSTPSSALVPRPPVTQTMMSTTGSGRTAKPEFTPEEQERIDRGRVEAEKANREYDEQRFRISRLG